MIEKLLFRSAGALAALLLFMSTAQAVVIETVQVGNPRNADDTRYADPGYGGVDYVYNIGKYEVTNAQYTEFLNAVDPEGTNPRDLYNAFMSSTFGGINFDSGADQGLKYSIRSGRGNMPVNYVSFWDACRFANWLHNGQGSGDTETGAYTLTPEGIVNNTVTRNPGWQWAVTSEDEWYKAAYYDGGSGEYYDYPTGSNTHPSAEEPAGTDMANGSANYAGVVGDLTGVGAYDAKPSDSAYGTYDQAGNVCEWNDTIVSTSYRGVRGDSFLGMGSGYFAMHASYRSLAGSPITHAGAAGFRVTTIAEPGSITLLACGLGLVASLIWWRRRR